MKHLSFNECKPTAGTHIAAFCAGMRGATFDGWGRDVRAGGRIGRRLPRRIAKRRASRIAHEHRMIGRRWGSRGNMAAAMAMPTDAGFTRFATEQ